MPRNINLPPGYSIVRFGRQLYMVPGGGGNRPPGFFSWIVLAVVFFVVVAAISIATVGMEKTEHWMTGVVKTVLPPYGGGDEEAKAKKKKKVKAVDPDVIVAKAKAINSGKKIDGWKNGKIDYAWGGGHGSNPGPSRGTCEGYHGSVWPCPAARTIGLDCSGLTRWVYALSYGDDVLGSGTAHSQRSRLKKISKSDRRPGDLVFFGKPSDIDHVGIYIGNGEMIEAPFTGHVIRKSRVNYRGDIVGYGRFVP